MCFIPSRNVPPKIAKEDIECYKIVRKDFKPFYGYSKRKYRLGKVYNAYDGVRKLKKLKIVDGVIRKGVHSYIDIWWVFNIFNNLLKTEKVLKCIIPKGTEYYENGEKYVSLKIIPKKIIYETK